MKLPSLFLLTLLCAWTANVSGQTVFHYQGLNSAGKDLPLIPDAGGAGNDGAADPSTRYSPSIPQTGLPSTAGNRSLNGRNVGGIVTGGTGELSNQAIASAGGFTMETWFNWNGKGVVNSLIDYAGTEKLVIDTQVADRELRMRINSDSTLDSTIATVIPGQWHYTAAVFDTQDNALDGGSISGVFHLYFDGDLVNTTDTLTITDFGDSLNRSIGIGKHPLGFADDFFQGLIFDPKVSLGALSASQLQIVVPEPTSRFGFAICGMLALFCQWRCREGK